jgi:uncharacterized protein
MPQNSREIVQNLYAAFAANDGAAALGLMHPRIVWMEAENTPHASGNPYIGPEAVAAGVFARLLSEWEEFTATPDRMIESGDVVVTLGRYRAVNRTTGLPVDAQFAHVWTVREGQIVAFQQYADTAQLLRASTAVVPSPRA